MLEMLGCSGLLAAIAFLIGLLVSLASPVGLGERLGLAGMVAGMTFLASAVLCLRDRGRQRADREKVRSWLASRPDVGEDAFVASIELRDRELALHLRDGLARFFNSAPSKISPDDLLSSYAFGAFMPVIYLAIMGPALERLGARITDPFPRQGLLAFRDLIQEARLQAATIDA